MGAEADAPWAEGHAPVRIVFSDMDDTFLSTDKSIPQGNLSLLDKLRELGVPFVPCTGRAWSAVAPEVLGHPATSYVVASDGAAVVDVSDPDHPRTLHTSPMGKERTRALYERVKDLDISFDVFWDGRIYTERRRYELVRTFDDLGEYDLRVFLGNRTPVDETIPELLERIGGVERVTVYQRGAYERARVIDAVERDPTLHYTYSTDFNLEIMDRDTSKGAGLRWLCGQLSIPVESSVGFGDSPNDLSMIEAAGDGVAVANAYEQVREAADHVAPWTNDEAAVARYLEPLLR